MNEFSNKRLLFLPPGVRKGKEKEPKCEDFICFQQKPLGQGAFGEVFKVQHKVSKKDFAIKVIKKRKIVERRMLPQLRREIRIMYSLRHPNIISLYSHFEDAENFYLIMEYAPGGQLFTRLKKFKTMPEAVAAQYMREICLAVQYLHSRIPAVIHRDIKPENILISADDSIKLGDFGWSNFLDDERDTYCGTLEYLAPEMVSRTGHGISLDIWSLGILLFELLVGHSPFKGKSQPDLFEKIRKAKPLFPKAFPLLAKDLVKKMLMVDPEKRPSAEQVLEHSWILSHVPLRPTVELVTEKVELPTVPDEGDVDFAESNYVVVSAPKTQETVNEVKKVFVKVSEEERVCKEIARKMEVLKRVKEKVVEASQENQELERRLQGMKREFTELVLFEDKIEACKKRISEIRHRNNLVYKRYVSKIAEINLVKKRKKIAEKKVWKIRNEVKIREMRLSVYKQSQVYLMKLNCFELLKNKISDLAYAISLIGKSFSTPKYISLAKQQLKNFSNEDIKSEIEKFVPEFKKLFTSKSKSVKLLSLKLKDAKKVSLLQSQIFKTLSLTSRHHKY